MKTPTRRLADNFYFMTGMVDDILKKSYTENSVEGMTWDDVVWPEPEELAAMKSRLEEMEKRLEDIDLLLELENDSDEAVTEEDREKLQSQIDDLQNEIDEYDSSEDRDEIYQWILWTGGYTEFVKKELEEVGVPYLESFNNDLFIGRQTCGQSVELDYWYYQMTKKYGYLIEETMYLEEQYYPNRWSERCEAMKAEWNENFAEAGDISKFANKYMIGLSDATSILESGDKERESQVEETKKEEV